MFVKSTHILQNGSSLRRQLRMHIGPRILDILAHNGAGHRVELLTRLQLQPIGQRHFAGRNLADVRSIELRELLLDGLQAGGFLFGEAVKRHHVLGKHAVQVLVRLKNLCVYVYVNEGSKSFALRDRNATFAVILFRRM